MATFWKPGAAVPPKATVATPGAAAPAPAPPTGRAGRPAGQPSSRLSSMRFMSRGKPDGGSEGKGGVDGGAGKAVAPATSAAAAAATGDGGGGDSVPAPPLTVPAGVGSKRKRPLFMTDNASTVGSSGAAELASVSVDGGAQMAGRRSLRGFNRAVDAMATSVVRIRSGGGRSGAPDPTAGDLFDSYLGNKRARKEGGDAGGKRGDSDSSSGSGSDDGDDEAADRGGKRFPPIRSLRDVGRLLLDQPGSAAAKARAVKPPSFVSAGGGGGGKRGGKRR